MAKGFPPIDLKKLLSVGHLPAMSQSAVYLLQVSQDPEAGPIDYAIPIETDPGLMVQVLKFVNSSYFGFRNELTNVKQAIALVGTRTIKNFVLYSAVFSLIPHPRSGPLDIRCLWQDSLRRAVFARAMTNLLGDSEAEEAFAAALLQDMAVPLLAKEVPEAYIRLLGARHNAGTQVRLSTLERHVYGWDHAEAAGIMVRKWKLPESFAVLIENHLDIDKWVANATEEPARLAVALSALLPTTSDEAWSEKEKFKTCFEKVQLPEGTNLIELLETIDQEFADFAPILKIATPSVTLAERFCPECVETA